LRPGEGSYIKEIKLGAKRKIYNLIYKTLDDKTTRDTSKSVTETA
jgi:hypothetical protein